MLTQRVHSAPTCIGMHAPTRAKNNARYAVRCEVNRVSPRPAYDRFRSFVHHFVLRGSKGFDDGQRFINQHWRIADVTIDRWFPIACALGKTSEDRSKLALDLIHCLTWDGTNIEVEAAFIRISREVSTGRLPEYRQLSRWHAHS